MGRESDTKSIRIRYPLISLCLSAAVMLMSAQSLSAEVFRVHEAKTVQLENDVEAQTVRAGVNDAIIIQLPADKSCIQGVEVSFKVPKMVADWQDSVAWSVYELNSSPAPMSIDFEGKRVVTGTFGASMRLNLKVPLRKDNDIKKDAYSTLLSQIPDLSKGFVFLRMQLAMKGVPDEILDETFEITIKPILLNKGRLSLEILPPRGGEIQDYTLFIDNSSVQLTKEGMLLDCGQHEISIVSDYYRNELRTVTIDRAKTSRLSITMRDIAPTLQVHAPQGSQVFFDDAILENPESEFVIEQGKHIIRIVVGDYETSRTVYAENGKSYTVSVQVDSTITEND